jgi:uncharacterized membrane-anchored protein YhcB (DUF1043 family)
MGQTLDPKSFDWQTAAALLIVGAAVIMLFRRFLNSVLKSSGNSGCSSCSSCAHAGDSLSNKRTQVTNLVQLANESNNAR